MKQLHYLRLLVVFLIVTGIFSCERLDEIYRISGANGSRVAQANDQTGGDMCEDECGEPLIIPLIHSGDMESTIGQIIVTKTDECLDLAIEMTAENWTFDQIYLYVGALDMLPLTEDPYPAFWDFPTTMVLDPPVSTYAHCVPLAELDDCFQILAQVHGVNAQGGAPLWSEGINPGWTAGPFYTDYCLDDCVQPSNSPCDNPCDNPCEEPCDKPCDKPCDCCKMGIYRTQTPGGWGAKPAGNNPGMYLKDNFDAAFPGGLVVGGQFKITLTSAEAIMNLLPTGGKPAVLTKSYENPKEIKNVLVGHVVALALSIGFDENDEDFGEADGHLKCLVIANGHGFDGMTVGQVLEKANLVLGGDISAYSPSQMVEILTKINEYFVDGKKSAKYDLFTCK